MFWGLKLDSLGLEATGGVGIWDWISRLDMEDIRMGFRGAAFGDLARTGGAFPPGGGGGVNLGHSGISWTSRLEREPLKLDVSDGGFGGAIGGGLREAMFKSELYSDPVSDGGFGGAIGGGCRVACFTEGSISPKYCGGRGMKDGGRGAEEGGGGGGAELGGGGISISPSIMSGTESILTFGRFVVLPVPFILGS